MSDRGLSSPTTHTLAAALIMAVSGWLIVFVAGDIGATIRPTSYQWWFRGPRLSYDTAHVWLYVGVVGLVAGWSLLGRCVRRYGLRGARFITTFILCCAPWFAGVPVFSRDVYSYVAQGLVAANHLNPYVASPVALGHGAVVQSVAWVWQRTPSPYGPLLILLGTCVGHIGAHSLITQVLMYRALAVIGLFVAALLVTPLSVRRGVDPGVARWLLVLSPLSLVAVVSSAHNDIFMIDLLLAAFVLADKGHRIWSFVVAGLAATIKLPALVASAFLVVADARRESRAERLREVGEALIATVVALTIPTLIAGHGWYWLSLHALKIPASIHTWQTPAVIIGSAIGAWTPLSSSAGIALAQILFELGTGIVGITLLRRAGRTDNVLLVGWCLLAVTLGNATLWPWYALWFIAPLAVSAIQRTPWLAIVAGGAMFLVGPGGTPLLGPSSFYVTAPLLALISATLIWRRRAR
jgi:hypothetical protein